MIVNREYYHIVAWEDCPYCQSAIELLSDSKLESHVEYTERDSELLVEAQQRHNWSTVPMITRVAVAATGEISQEFIGGYTDLLSHLGNNEEAQT